ncbi:MAG: MFS transporter [Pseudomonadales bacterium]|nr:MFS transporter [Pseudomonadales bacterium]
MQNIHPNIEINAMGTTFLSLISLFVSCFILMLGNGLLNVLLPVKMEIQGLSTDTIGLVLSLYFVGMLLGAIYSKYLIIRAGHIRVFAGCVALGAISILLCSFDTDPILWGAMRIALGFCNACAYSAMESWLSDSSTKESRGKILATYNAVVLGGLFGGQFLMNFAAPGDNTLFVMGGILLCLAIIPIALSKNVGPVIEEVAAMSIVSLFKKSPLGVVCCITGGLVFAALLNMLPVFAKANSIVDFQLTLYMGAAIFGAFILQFPVGYLSDKFDRRSVLLVLLLISATVGVMATVVAPLQIEWPLFVATSVTTGIIACLYPLSISEAFDKLRQNEMVAAMGSMILAFSIGGIIGPYSAALVMDLFGNNSLFYYLAVIQLLLAGFVVYRMSVRDSLPIEKQENFVMQGSTIAAMVDLDPRTEYQPVVQHLSQEAQTAISIAATDQGAAVKMACAIVVAQPQRAVEMASALASVEGIDVLRLYEVMQQVLPYRIMEIALAIVSTKPDLAYELVQQLAQSHPDQVVSVAAEIGQAYPDLRVAMAKVAVESAPESALQVAEYYAQVVAEEREALRPADEADDTSEQDVLEIAAELWEVAPEHALAVAVTMVEAVPETAVLFATELAENIIDSDTEAYVQPESANSDETTATALEESEFETDAALHLVQSLTQAVPESAVELAVAVVETIPEAAAVVAAEVAATFTAESEPEDKLQLAVPVSAEAEASLELDQLHQEALETDAAVDLVQRLTEVAPDNALDVAVAIVEALPESAVAIATEVMGNIAESLEEQAQPMSKMEEAHQAAIETDTALDLVQRLAEVAPENTIDVAAAMVDAVPQSASQLIDIISEGSESIEGEWVNALDADPRGTLGSTETDKDK